MMPFPVDIKYVNDAESEARNQVSGVLRRADQLVLLPRPDSPDILGPIYWWDHETWDLNKVCDGFDELE